MRAWKEKGRSSDVHLIVWIYPRLATKADGLQHPQTQTPAFRHTQTRVQTFRHDPGHTIAGERCCQARQNQERAHAHAHLRLSREPHQGRQRGRRPVRAPRTPHTKDTPTCATDSHRPRRPRARTQPATQPRGWAGSAGSQGSAPGSRRAEVPESSSPALRRHPMSLDPQCHTHRHARAHTHTHTLAHRHCLAGPSTYPHLGGSGGQGHSGGYFKQKT